MGNKIQIITKEDLKSVIQDRIKEFGNECDLNDIDVNKITDMSYLFYGSQFNGNISDWNTSNVTNMSYMFDYSQFDGDISNWNVSNVFTMYYMFANSKFNKDISRWDVSNVINMAWIFIKSEFNQNINNWKLRKSCEYENVHHITNRSFKNMILTNKLNQL